MKRYFNVFIMSVILLVMEMSSSCNYLSVDKYFDDTLKYDSVFHNKLNLEKYMWGAASGLPDEGRIFENEFEPGLTATDELFTLFNTGNYRGKAFTLGVVTSDNALGMIQWTEMYRVIRKTNTIFARINECKDLSTLDRQDILGYTHFIRAYAYFHILMSFGPVIILDDQVLESNLAPDYYNRSRATYDESVDYICSEFELAAKYMPLTVPISQFGRPTKGAAYGLIARLRLQDASPLYNGGTSAKTYFGNWVRSEDNLHYISQTYDKRKWALAAAAAKRVINMGIYSLYTVESDANTPQLPPSVSTTKFPNGAGGIDPLKSYSQMFNGEAFSARNQEFVWGRMSGEVKEYTRRSFPLVMMGGWNGFSVPQKMIDGYRMADGKTIEEAGSDGIYGYSENGFTNEKKAFSGYVLNSHVYRMYANREMRFYANIGFNGCIWPANSTTDQNKKNLTITYTVDGNSGRTATGTDLVNYPITGYVLKKYIHPDDAWSGAGAEVLEKPFPIIRYAEILLSYAEALNNLEGTQEVTLPSGETYSLTRDVAEIANAFNQVRYRAGLPGLKDTELASKDEMFNQIVRERMVEFMFENRRYFDIRRWGIYEDVDKEPIVGMNTDAREDNGYFQRTVINCADARNRIVDKKMIFLPISRQELRKVPKLDQNPGW